MPEDTDDEEIGGTHFFWSGTIAFGLVSLPVSLYTANRGSTVALKMLAEDGTPLARRYFCSREDVPLSSDDLVRGYEIEREEFIEVSDEELAALAPSKSREIDLRRFVPLHAVDPMFFERAYFLVPEEGAVKAYRLLAKTMESASRAGIATVVMRGKEYLIAIIAEQGILRAETLRFHDELRTPADVGLPPLAKASAVDMKAIAQAIQRLAIDELDPAKLTDESSHRLLELVERKLEADEGVFHVPEVSEQVPERESAEIIDLMQVLKRSLEGKAPKGKANSTKDNSSKATSTKNKNTTVSRAKPKAAQGKTRTAEKRNDNRKGKTKGKGGQSGIDPDMSKSAL